MLLKNDTTIIRVLKSQGGKALVIDCIKRTMPKWVDDDIRLQEPNFNGDISELFHRFYADYLKFQFQLSDQFQLIYNTDFLLNN